MIPGLSNLGLRMSHLTGVRAIMKDIIETLRTSEQSFMNLSAGNPVILPEIEQLWRTCTEALLASDEFGQVVCRYGMSQGYEPLIAAVKQEFKRIYDLSLGDRQILITPGSQALYFLAANAFGGQRSDGSIHPVVLPLCPDYTGYGGVSIAANAVQSYRPILEIDEAQHRFKYRPDFEQFHINQQTGCVIFSRPCNPTGNILTDAETLQIAQLAAPYNVPVFIDSAYGQPFPGLNYQPMTPLFPTQMPNVVHCMSLSKVGLPGERVGIAIGDERIIEVLESFQTNLCIHSSRYGQAIAARAIATGKLSFLAETVIRPYYQAKREVLEQTLDRVMPECPWFLHQGDGGIFGWLWFADLPITDHDLYQRLKAAGVIVVPGHPFFPGLSQDWDHAHQCLRISLTATDAEIEAGMERLAQVIAEVY